MFALTTISPAQFITTAFNIVASCPAYVETLNEIVNKADDALYMSKRLGRNRVTVWSEANHIEKPQRLSLEE